MIVEGLIRFLVGTVEFIIDLFPTTNPPAWMGNGMSGINTALGYASGLGVWIPWNTVGMVFQAVLACVVISFTVKLVRIIASFFTAGGGSAA